MKHLILFEEFAKNYGKAIKIEDFKNIKKGSTVLYKGSEYDVIESTGSILKLKNERGQMISVNFNMFNQGGAIRKEDSEMKENLDEQPNFEIESSKIVLEGYSGLQASPLKGVTSIDQAIKEISKWLKSGDPGSNFYRSNFKGVKEVSVSTKDELTDKAFSSKYSDEYILVAEINGTIYYSYEMRD